MAKPRRTFAEIDAARPRYNPAVEGYGTASDWRGAFNERMGLDEARRVLGGEDSPRAILGVIEGATWPEIKRAYRTLVRDNHPDTKRDASAKAKAEKTLTRINAAFAMLGNQMGQ